ncbi:MAG: hypothetical protein ACP6IS_05285 [Candidatus Asgardarchaeia archaeon]
MRWIFPFLRKPKVRLTKPKLKSPPKPSLSFLSILLVIFSLFLLGGGVFTITNVGEPWFIPLGQSIKTKGLTFIYIGTLNSQLVLEGFIASFFYALGFLGFMLIYESSKHAKNVYRGGYAEKLLIIGIVLVFVSYILLQWLLITKLPGIYQS